MGRKFKCIESYKSGEFLTKGNIYELNGTCFRYDDGWVDKNCDLETDSFGKKMLVDLLEEIKEEDKKVREFKVGDRVEALDNYWGKCLVEISGTIIEDRKFDVGICFDKNIEGHDCNGKCESGYGWYLKREQLKFAGLSNNSKSIHITTDGTSTHAVLKDGKSVIIKRAKVGLYHTDEYKFETGVIEVVKKLFDIVDEKKKVVDDGNFSVRCVRNDNGDCGLTIGKVYKFVDGYSNWNSGNKFPQKRENGIDRFRNIDDLNEWLDDKSYGFELIREEVKTELSRYTNSELLDEIKRRMEK